MLRLPEKGIYYWVLQNEASLVFNVKKIYSKSCQKHHHHQTTSYLRNEHSLLANVGLNVSWLRQEQTLKYIVICWHRTTIPFYRFLIPWRQTIIRIIPNLDKKRSKMTSWAYVLLAALLLFWVIVIILAG